VLVSVARVAGMTKHQRCAFLTPERRLTRFRSCCKPVLLRARGSKKWSFSLKPRRLPRGNYRIVVRAIDVAGHKERPQGRNIERFRIR
jgi:hypothetical protein